MGYLAAISYASYESHRVAQHRPISIEQPNKSAKPNSPHDEKQPPKSSVVPQHVLPVVPDVRIPPIIDGLAPVVATLPTTQPVVFLGIDDGAHKTKDELQMMNDNHIKATLFLSRLFINDDPNFFKDFTSSGSLIENHTLSHNTNMVSTMSYEQQKQEICGMADYELEHYGRRPLFFRPPGGAYSTTMRRAAADCGMKAVVTWIAKANGGSMQYQIGNELRAGDVVLMHFRPEFRQDMQAFIDAQNRAGLHTELLENWISEQ